MTICNVKERILRQFKPLIQEQKIIQWRAYVWQDYFSYDKNKYFIYLFLLRKMIKIFYILLNLKFNLYNFILKDLNFLNY